MAKEMAQQGPFSYPDKTDFNTGPTEAHRALSKDKQSFMFEQVRSVWVARNWCSIFAATIGMLGPPIVEAPVVSWMMQRGIPTLVYGSTVAWVALEVLRHIDDVLGNFSQEELEDRRAVSLSISALPACPAWTFSLLGHSAMRAIPLE